jgi:hypothetical protein
MKRRVILLCLLVLCSACTAQKFNRKTPNLYTKAVCTAMINDFLDKKLIKQTKQVLVARDRDVCTQILVTKLRAQKIGVLAPVATSLAPSGDSNDNNKQSILSSIPTLTFVSDELGENLILAALIITHEGKRTTYNQTFSVTYKPNSQNKFEITPIGVTAVGSL